MSDAHYFFNRQGETAGPHPLDEIAAFIHSGEISADSWVFREGDETWQAATSFPELASILSAASLIATPVAAEPAAAAESDKGTSATPASGGHRPLTKVPYTAGQKPTSPGPYVRLAHLPAEAVALLTAAIPAPPPPHKRHPLRTLMILGLWMVILGALVIDLGVGFDRWVFTQVLAPVSLAAILLVMYATHSRSHEALARVRQSRPGSKAGLVALVLLFTCVGGLLVSIGARSEVALLVIVVVFIVLARALRDKRPPALTEKELGQVERMTVCRDVVAALADDVAAGKAVTGWADVTGAQQPGKLMARGQATSGAKVELFRDEWLHVSAPLRDGTRLRLAAVDREKVKHAHSRRRGRKTKTKPGSTQTLATLEIRVRVHPQVYRPMAPAAQTGQVGGVLLTSIAATADSVSAVFTRPSSGLLLADVLHAVTHVYRHLERLPAASGGAR
jgi:hypothetical protein